MSDPLKRQRISQLLHAAAEAYAAMTPEEKATMHEAQRKSWVRGMAPCEHGVGDWESCPDCIAKWQGGSEVVPNHFDVGRGDEVLARAERMSKRHGGSDDRE